MIFQWPCSLSSLFVACKWILYLRGRFFRSNMNHVRVHPILRMSHPSSTPNLFPGFDPCFFPIATFPVGADDSTSLQTLKPSVPFCQMERYAEDLRWIFYPSSSFDWFTHRRTMPSVFGICCQSRLHTHFFFRPGSRPRRIGNRQSQRFPFTILLVTLHLDGPSIRYRFWTNNADEQWYAAVEELVHALLTSLNL